jgi:hypothetical protein
LTTGNLGIRIRALADRGEHLCKLLLRDDGSVPGGLWSWKVYVDGDVHARGPGSKRKDPLKWYATLPRGEHRIVIREADEKKPDRRDSNTLHFVVDAELEIVLDVMFRDGAVCVFAAD